MFSNFFADTYSPNTLLKTENTLSTILNKHKKFIRNIDKEIDKKSWRIFSIPNKQKYMIILQNPGKGKSRSSINNEETRIIEKWLESGRKVI